MTHIKSLLITLLFCVASSPFSAVAQTQDNWLRSFQRATDRAHKATRSYLSRNARIGRALDTNLDRATRQAAEFSGLRFTDEDLTLARAAVSLAFDPRDAATQAGLEDVTRVLANPDGTVTVYDRDGKSVTIARPDDTTIRIYEHDKEKGEELRTIAIEKAEATAFPGLKAHAPSFSVAKQQAQRVRGLISERLPVVQERIRASRPDLFQKRDQFESDAQFRRRLADQRVYLTRHVDVELGDLCRSLVEIEDRIYVHREFSVKLHKYNPNQEVYTIGVKFGALEKKLQVPISQDKARSLFENWEDVDKVGYAALSPLGKPFPVGIQLIDPSRTNDAITEIPLPQGHSTRFSRLSIKIWGGDPIRHKLIGLMSGPHFLVMDPWTGETKETDFEAAPWVSIAPFGHRLAASSRADRGYIADYWEGTLVAWLSLSSIGRVVTLSPDGQAYVIPNTTGQLEVWSVDREEELFSIEVKDVPGRILDWEFGGEDLLALVTTRSAFIFDISSRTEKLRINPPDDYQFVHDSDFGRAIEFSLSGNVLLGFIAHYRDHRRRFSIGFDPETGAELFRIPFVEGKKTMSPEGSLVVQRDKVYDSETGDVYLRLTEPAGFAMISEDSRFLFAQHSGGDVGIYKTFMERTGHACSSVLSPLHENQKW